MTKEQAEKLILLYHRVGAELQQASDYIKDNSESEGLFDKLLPIGKVMGALYMDLKNPIYQDFPDLIPEDLDGPYIIPSEVLNPGFYDSPYKE